MLPPGRSPEHVRTGYWSEFTLGTCKVAVTTESGCLALPCGVKSFAAYINVPTMCTFLRRSHRGAALVFFDTDEELEAFKHEIGEKVLLMDIEPPEDTEP
jgi:hypothetical protein